MTRTERRTGVSICGTTAAGFTCTLKCAASGLGAPERLVGYGFRHWIEGRRTGDLAPWERAWSLYCGMFGPARARIAVGSLSDWVAAVELGAGRTIKVAGTTCPDFCRDECLAISMIAACQHDTCPAMRACAFALLEDRQTMAPRLDAVTAPAQHFARTMASLDQVLSKASILATSNSLAPVTKLQS